MLNRLLQLPRDSRDTLFLLAVVAWVILPHAANLPAWALLMAGLSLGWRGWLAWHARPLPTRWWLMGLLLMAMAGTLWSHKTLLGRDAGVTLVVALLALKTLEMRARRDAFVVFFLGFFTMLTHFFFSQSLPVALAMLLGLLGLLTALINANLPVGRPPLATSAGLALRMTAWGAPVMVALFVLFPRVAPLWGLPTDAQGARSGLSSRMSVGDVSELALDDSIAFRLRFLNATGAPPEQRQLYFRGPVFSVFDGREWKQRLPEELMGQTLYRRPPVTLKTQGTPVAYELTLEPNNRPWLLTLDASAEAPRLGTAIPYATPELQWVMPRPVTALLRYQAVAYPDFSYGPPANDPALRLETELPPGYNPRTLQLASDMRRDPRLAGADDAALVQQVLKRLATGGYTYTLEPGLYGRDTADEFWFDRKAGFCEHVASSFVVLMRALDIPARVVTGYQGGDRNPLDGYWTLRQSDAHAWAEVWLNGQGWVRVDPTAAIAPGRVGSVQRLVAPRGVVVNTIATLSPGLMQTLRGIWEATNNRWNQWVLNYTQGRQLDLLRKLGFEAPSWEDLVLVMGGLLAVSALSAGAWQLWDRRQHDPWLRLLHRAQAMAQARGLETAGVATPRSLGRQALQHWGAAAQPLQDWLLQLERQRYAVPGSTGDSVMSPTLKDLDRQLRHLAWPARPH